MRGAVGKLSLSPIVIAASGCAIVLMATASSGGSVQIALSANFAVIVVYAILGNGSVLSEAAAVFMLGLFSDLISGDAIGAGTLALFAGFGLFRGVALRLKQASWLVKIGLFPAFAATVIGLEWALSSIASLTYLPLGPSLVQVIVTSIAYAAIAALAGVFRFRRRSRPRMPPVPETQS